MSLFLRRLVSCMAVLALTPCACSGTSQDNAEAGRPGTHEDEFNAPDDEGPLERRASSSTPIGNIPGLANPADVKCVEDGYRLEYVRVDGVPIKGLCVNDETGAKCESWAFFRGECSLDRSTPLGEGIPPR